MSPMSENEGRVEASLSFLTRVGEGSRERRVSSCLA